MQGLYGCLLVYTLFVTAPSLVFAAAVPVLTGAEVSSQSITRAETTTRQNLQIPESGPVKNGFYSSFTERSAFREPLNQWPLLVMAPTGTGTGYHVAGRQNPDTIGFARSSALPIPGSVCLLVTGVLAAGVVARRRVSAQRHEALAI